MKKFILSLTIAVTAIACNNEKKPIEVEVVERITPEMADSLIAPLDDLQRHSVLIDSAKSLIDSSTYYVKKGMNNEMPNKAVNKKLGVIMNNYIQLMKEMNPKDTIIVHEYRLKKGNELIDLQVSKQQ